MNAKQPQECGFGRGSASTVQKQLQTERLDYKQRESEDEPCPHHRMHPPEMQGPEPRPQTEPLYHVEARGAGEKYCAPCLPDETTLDGLEDAVSVLAELTVAQCSQDGRDNHGDGPDPNDHSQHVHGTRENEIIHGLSVRAPVPRLPELSSNG